ncbi:MAG: tetratricopeptide repeat protein, partial [Gemmatimonadetes bacterium]|nr:tetratricopeptide repeat protein [Gemmatimonadota bacterium]
KLLASDAEGAAVTGEGEALFTPERAAPEQRLGRPVTTATDVWALGVLLRELAGEKGELQAIVAQALHEEPERRYRSAGELGDDVDRALAGLPVRAKPDTLRYRTARFLRRNRGATVSAALIATLLVMFGISSWRSGRALERERDAAVAARDESDRVSGFLVGLLESTNPRVNPGADSLGVRGLIRLGEERVDDLTDLPGVRVKLWRTFAELRRTRSELTEERALLERALSDARAAGREDEVLELESARARNSFNLDGAAVARPLLEDVLHRTEVRYGPESPETLAALLDLQPALADLDARRDLLDRATRIATICSPSPSLGLARVWNERGNTEWHAGNLPAASDAYGRALGELDSALGPDHPHTLVVRNNLAATQLRAGDFPAAESTLRAVLESRRRVLGDDTIDVATTLQNLGSLYAQTGDARQAVERLREALRILHDVYGPDHVETIAARSDLGRALVLSADAEAGLATMDAMYARAVKRQDSETWWLAGLRLRRLEAEANAGRAIRIDAAQAIREELGKVSRDRESLARADVLLASAILADRGGDAPAAVAALEEALSIQESAGLAAHPMYAHARCALAVARARIGVAPDLATLEADLVRAEAWGLSFPAVLGDANALAGRAGRDR